MHKIKPYLIPLLLFLVSFLLRLYFISKGPYHVDCLTLAIKAEQTLETLKLHYLHSHGFPLTAILGALFVFFARIFSINDPVMAVNFMSVFFSSLCVPALYFLVKKLLENNTAAFLSAALLSISPIFLGISEFGNSHTPSLFIILCAFSTLLTYLRSSQKKHMLYTGFLFGLAAATRLQDAVFVIPAVAFLIWTGLDDTQDDTSHFSRQIPTYKIKQFLSILGIGSLILFIFYCPFFVEQIQNCSSGGLSRFIYGQLAKHFRGVSPFLQKLSLKYILVNFSSLGLLSIFLGVILLFKKQKNILLFLLIWAIFPYLLLSTLAIITPRLLFIGIIPLYIIQGYFFSRLLQINRYFYITSLLIIVVLGYINFSRIHPILEIHHKYEFLPDFIRWIGKNTEDNARLVVAEEGNFVSYYSNLIPIRGPLKVLHPYTQNELQIYKTELDSALEQNIPVYITTIALYSHDPNRQFSDFIKQHYKLKLMGQKYAEDWHRGALFPQIGIESVFKILPALY